MAGTTTNLDVTASVVPNCIITTAPVAFGPYDPIGGNANAPQTGTGIVTTTCTDGTVATITLGQGSNIGTNSTDDIPVRQMSDGGVNFLSYSLYSDLARTTVWGNTPVTGVGVLGTGMSQDMPIYGLIPSGQNKPAGTYTDTVVATVSY